MHLSLDRTQFYFGSVDDSEIASYETSKEKLAGRIRGIDEIETFGLTTGGKFIIISESANLVHREISSVPPFG